MRTDNATFVSEKVHKVIYSSCNPELGDLLLIKDGAITGRVTINNLEEPFSLLSSVALIKTNENYIDNRYIMSYLRSPVGQEAILGRMSGSAIPRIILEKIRNTKIALPPLMEQHRIVEKVDELMALCDEIERKKTEKDSLRIAFNDSALTHLVEAKEPKEFATHWNRIKSNFDMLYDTPETVDKLRQTILQLAVQGKLVPQDPNDEHGSELLEKISIEKNKLVKENKNKKIDSLLKIRTEDHPYDLPNGWVWCWLGDIAIHIQDGTHFSPKEQFSERTNDRYLYITSKNIKNDGVRIDNATFVSKQVHEEIYSRCNPEYGDLLLIKDGAITGRVTLNNLNEQFSMLSSVALIKTEKRHLNNRYLMSYLRSPVGREMILGRMSGSAIPRIILEKIRNTKVALPPLAEQHRIASKVDELMVLCDEMEQQLKRAEFGISALVESLLSRFVNPS